MSVVTALISGAMYDDLYTGIAGFARAQGFDVVDGLRADHPHLNAHLAEAAATGDLPYDLVSTHTKYAPSQAAFLAPLDELLDAAELADFLSAPLQLAHIGSQLYGLPRNVDVRLLHYRTDLIDRAPATWDELVRMARAVNRPPDLYGFVFPGMESGLFGSFYELCEAAGAHLFPADLVPQIMNEGGRWALNLLRTCYADGIVPPQIDQWHYDKVHDCFRDGHAAMVGDWPGYYGDYVNPATSAVHDRFRLARYPAGPSGQSRVYGGSHTFALTKRGAQKPEAVALLRYLTAHENQLAEARAGSVPVRRSVMQTVQGEATPVERERWQTLQRAIEDVVIPPKLARYPEIEEVLWTTVQEAVVGRLGIDAALEQMTAQIRAIVAGFAEGGA